jgi:hypothetical protein
MTKMFLSAIVFGLGASLRPEVLALMFFILSNRRLARSGGFYLLVGILTGMLVLCVVTELIGAILPIITHAAELPVVESVELVLGAALLASGVIMLVRRVKFKLPVLPENFRPAYLALAGMMLTVTNWHVILFTLAAMDRITVSPGGQMAKATALMIFLLLSLMTVLLPLSGYMLAPVTAVAWLAALNHWIDAHFYKIAGALVVVFGMYLVWHGL